MAANMKVNTRRLGEDIAALSDRLAAMQRTAAELERIAGGTGAYWTGAAAENFRRQFTAQTCQLADLLDTLGAAAGDETPALPTEFIQ